METLDIIKESFETWYNQSQGEKTSVVINYSDTQKVSIKAFHTACIEMCLIGADGETTAITPLLKLQENYNHGITSEQEAKDMLTKKLLVELYNYMR